MCEHQFHASALRVSAEHGHSGIAAGEEQAIPQLFFILKQFDPPLLAGRV